MNLKFHTLKKTIQTTTLAVEQEILFQSKKTRNNEHEPRLSHCLTQDKYKEELFKICDECMDNDRVFTKTGRGKPRKIENMDKFKLILEEIVEMAKEITSKDINFNQAMRFCLCSLISFCKAGPLIA